MSRWWRAYAEARNDPKLQGLPLDMFRAWFNLCCLAAERDGKIPSILDASMALHMPESKAKAAVAFLAGRKLLDAVPGGYFEPHNWNARQYKSDVSTDRVKRFRERSRSGDETFHETEMKRPQITDTESEREIPSVSPRKRARPKCHLPLDFALGPEDTAYAAKHNWLPDKIKIEFERFCDHAMAAGRRQVDWHAAWRNWVTSPYSNSKNGAKNGPSSPNRDLLKAADELVERARAEHAAACGEEPPSDRESAPFAWPIPQRRGG